MYNSIQLSDPYEKNTKVLESFSTDPLMESSTPEQLDLKLYTEAVFSGGKEKLKPIVDRVNKVKEYLESCIQEQDKSVDEVNDWAKKKAKDRGAKPKVSNFDPKAFWRSTLFKDLEDNIGKIFGFRNVEIHPYIEKYSSKTKDFQSKELNCMIYHVDRYPVEGLVTDNGFFDKSRSLTMEIHITLGLIHELTAEEIVAVLLHEFGHGIDPALVDIKYTQTNILSKYMTDRKGAINRQEKKFLDTHKLSEMGTFFIIYALFIFLSIGIAGLFNKIKELIIGKEKLEQKKLDKIKEMVKADKSKFERQQYSEAYADNFARMYGFGTPLMSGLKKLSKSMERTMNSRIKKEKARQDAIIYITQSMINDVHKTDIHRIRALLKEYDMDINDPNTPAPVKKQLQDDKAELEKVLDEYLNNFSEFQNRVNKVINDELKKKEAKDVKAQSANEKVDKKQKEQAVTEGVEFFDESKKAYEKLMKAKESLNPQERAEVKKKFGHTGCSFAKDKNGYYCFTHRCRSKSYPTIDKIPQKDVDFVDSTC